MSGDLNLPYEDVPDGPINLSVEGHICGGVAMRFAVCEPAPGQKMPMLIFDFYEATGNKLPPIMLALSVEDALGHVELVRKGVAAVVREARR